MFSAPNISQSVDHILKSKGSHRGDGFEMTSVDQDEELIEKAVVESQCLRRNFSERMTTNLATSESVIF